MWQKGFSSLPFSLEACILQEQFLPQQLEANWAPDIVVFQANTTKFHDNNIGYV